MKNLLFLLSVLIFTSCTTDNDLERETSVQYNHINIHFNSGDYEESYEYKTDTKGVYFFENENAKVSVDTYKNSLLIDYKSEQKTDVLEDVTINRLSDTRPNAIVMSVYNSEIYADIIIIK